MQDYNNKNYQSLSSDTRAFHDDYLRILSRFPRMLLAGWHPIDSRRGHFGDPSHDEAGMRAMGSVTFTAALLATDPGYDEVAGGCDRARLLTLARQSLAYMTDGHKSGTGCCADGQAWGDAWQSAWWASRMAAGAQLMWSLLDSDERAAVERVVVFEANRHLTRIVPSGLAEDTKAEENAWDAEILASACAIFPVVRHLRLARHVTRDGSARPPEIRPHFIPVRVTRNPPEPLLVLHGADTMAPNTALNCGRAGNVASIGGLGLHQSSPLSEASGPPVSSAIIHTQLAGTISYSSSRRIRFLLLVTAMTIDHSTVCRCASESTRSTCTTTLLSRTTALTTSAI